LPIHWPINARSVRPLSESRPDRRCAAAVSELGEREGIESLLTMLTRGRMTEHDVPQQFPRRSSPPLRSKDCAVGYQNVGWRATSFTL
jgi:hypothetical protein